MSLARLREAFRFELVYYLGRISTWAYFAVFLAVGLLLGHIYGGAFDSVNISVGGASDSVMVNAPWALMRLSAPMSLFGILAVAALAGHAGYRDYGHGIHPLFHTTPVTPLEQLGGRYLASVLLGTFVVSGLLFGLFLCTYMPWLDADVFGPNRASGYLVPIAVFIFPNVALTAALFVSIAALTRARLPHYVGGVGLFVAYMVGGNLLDDIGDEWMAALVDPFGLRAMSWRLRYWTAFEQANLQPGFDPWILGNRALWLTLSLVTFAAVVSRIRYDHDGLQLPWRRTRPTERDPYEPVIPRSIQLPTATRHDDVRARLVQFRFLTGRTFRDMLANAYFGAILAGAMLFLGMTATQIGEIYGTPTWPVTYMILEGLGGTFTLFVIIILTFYAGELVWQERDLKVQPITDSMPVPTWVPWLAKVVAMFTLLGALLVVVMVVGVVTQLGYGYTHFELGLYLRSLYLMTLPDYLLLSILAISVQAAVNHKYVGHMIVIGWYLFTGFMGPLGFEHALWRFGSDLGSTYSDMNAFGPYLWPFVVFKTFWGSVAVLLAIASNVLWVRGGDVALNTRLRIARDRLSPPLLALGGVSAAISVGLGAFILYNTHVLHEYETSWDGQVRSAEYERRFKGFEEQPQPRVTGMKLEVDLYPSTGDLGTRGELSLRNKHEVPIDEIFVMVPRPFDENAFAFDREAELLEEDEKMGVRRYRLAQPLAPGDELGLSYDWFFPEKGFANGGQNTVVVDNGTFVHSPAIVPSFGYSEARELSTDRVRKKHGLEPKERMADLDDEDARANTYISRDSDWIDFEATVSTDVDQIALAPGYLQKEWVDGDRRYFHYAMDSKILNFTSFLSARYVVVRDRWRDVNIEVYHHPGHEWNVERMIEGVKASLELFSREFSPYQHRQVRIVEFPRYATFAQSFPNTIPYSESIGFIARVGEDDVDYPFYVTAHEVAHQWWAHQVIGANVQGSTVMSETLSQYSALLVMEEELGEDQIHEFLEHELKSYLMGRATERKKELPLLRVENQQYIHYNKGSLALWLLRDHLGAETVNRALSNYIDEVAFQDPPYTTSRDLLRHLDAVTPADRKYLLTDLFETITLYENRALEARARRVGDSWEVTLDYEAKKLQASEKGEQTEVALADWIDIGVFDEDGEKLYLEKHLIEQTSGSVTVTVQGEPATAGIDPWHKLIDRHPNDNDTDVERTPDA